MKLGGTYVLHKIAGGAWRKLGAELAMRPEPLLNRVRAMADALPEHMQAVASAARIGGLDHPMVERLSTTLSERARYCRRLLD